MKRYEFTIIASGLDPKADDFEDRFFEAGCGDSTITFQKGRIALEFTREAPSFADALVSAIRNVRAAGAKVERVEPDYLVSLSDIAERTGLSRTAVSLFSKGERGKGFPAPIARLTTSSPLWDWVQVATWMRARQQVSDETVFEAILSKAATAAVAPNWASFESNYKVLSTYFSFSPFSPDENHQEDAFMKTIRTAIERQFRDHLDENDQEDVFMKAIRTAIERQFRDHLDENHQDAFVEALRVAIEKQFRDQLDNGDQKVA
jgi:hypothetical protein